MPIGNWVYLLVVFIYVLLLAYGSIFIKSNFYIESYNSGKTGKKQIAITFDDGPLQELTPAILDVLSEFQVKATFFCIGNRIQGNEHIMKSMLRSGHIIGNHSYTHSVFFDFLPTGRLIKDLAYTNELIYKVTGSKPVFFRPPFGVTNPMIAKAAKLLRLKVIGWNVRSMDGVVKDENRILDNVLKKLSPGAVILFHDSNPALPSVLRKLFEYADEQGYKFVGLDELLDLKAYV